MKKHVEIYIRYFGSDDFYPCEVCSSRATDVHHIKYKSRGGKDKIENLMGLCRNCHTQAHQELLKENELKKIHNEYLER